MLYVYICVVSVLPPSAVDVVNQELVPNRPPQWQRGNKFELTDQRVFTQLFELVPARSIIFHLRQWIPYSTLNISPYPHGQGEHVGRDLWQIRDLNCEVQPIIRDTRGAHKGWKRGKCYRVLYTTQYICLCTEAVTFTYSTRGKHWTYTGKLVRS